MFYYKNNAKVMKYLHVISACLMTIFHCLCTDYNMGIVNDTLCDVDHLKKKTVPRSVKYFENDQVYGCAS